MPRRLSAFISEPIYKFVRAQRRCFFSEVNPEAARRLLKVGEAFRIAGPFFSPQEMAADDGTPMLPAEGEREKLRKLCGAAA